MWRTAWHRRVGGDSEKAAAGGSGRAALECFRPVVIGACGAAPDAVVGNVFEELKLRAQRLA